MTGRGATACALYAGFLAFWAFGDGIARREPSPYLGLGAALLETVLIGGAAAALFSLGSPEPSLHAAYLILSVLLLPVGALLARAPSGRLEAAPLGVALVALAVVITRVAATA